MPSNPPTVRILGGKRQKSKGPRVVVRGSAFDIDGDLARVEVVAGQGKFRPARGLGRWRFPARLKPGRTTVKARAIDKAGNRSRMARSIILYRR